MTPIYWMRRTDGIGEQQISYGDLYGMIATAITVDFDLPSYSCGTMPISNEHSRNVTKHLELCQILQKSAQQTIITPFRTN